MTIFLRAGSKGSISVHHILFSKLVRFAFAEIFIHLLILPFLCVSADMLQSLPLCKKSLVCHGYVPGQT